MVFDFLFLCQFAENDGFQVHPCPYQGHALIDFDGCITFHGVNSMVKMCHIFPVQSIIDGHLCWLQVFAIANSAAMQYPLEIYTVMGLLGKMKFLFLSLCGITTLSSTIVELIYTPTSRVKVFLFLHILSRICCFQIF